MMKFVFTRVSGNGFGRYCFVLFSVSLLLGLAACSDSSSPTESAPDGNSGTMAPDGSQNNPPVDFAPVVDPNDVVPEPTDVDISNTLLIRQDYQTLLGLIERADLAAALQEDNMGLGWTLFAPSDLAFENDEFEAMSTAQRDALIKGHLYSGTLMFADLQPGLLSMTQGSIEISQNDDDTISVGGATVIARDRVVGNGVIHFVDAVLEITP